MIKIGHWTEDGTYVNIDAEVLIRNIKVTTLITSISIFLDVEVA